LELELGANMVTEAVKVSGVKWKALRQKRMSRQIL